MDTVDSQYDLILSRHTMIHLKFRDIVRVFDNFIRSGSRYLLMTQHANLENNDLQTTDAHTGRSVYFKIIVKSSPKSKSQILVPNPGPKYKFQIQYPNSRGKGMGLGLTI